MSLCSDKAMLVQGGNGVMNLHINSPVTESNYITDSSRPRRH